jgi:virulence-associated protein VapD
VPRLCEFYPGICLTTEEKAWKTFSQGKKNLSQLTKNLSQGTVYIAIKNKEKLVLLLCLMAATNNWFNL